MYNKMLMIFLGMGMVTYIFAQGIPGSHPAAEKRFPFKSAKIVYAYYGMIEGEETLYIDQHGGQIVLISEISIGGYPEEKTYIWKNGKAAVIDHLKSDMPESAGRPEKMAPLSAPVREDSLIAAGYRYSGGEDIAGVTCRRFGKQEKDSIWKTWVWEGIELKRYIQNVNRQSYTREALSVELNADIPPQVFETAAEDAQP